MDLLVEPLDVWLFRDGRPFTAGEDHLASSMFPPSPLTMYGVLRSLLAAERARTRGMAGPFDPATLMMLVGEPDDFHQFRLRGPWIAQRTDGDWARLVPAPRDLVGGGDTQRFATLGPPERNIPGLASNAPAGFPWTPADGGDAVAGWVTEEDLASYLGGTSPTAVAPSDRLFVREPRPGLQLDRARRTAEEGRFYGIEFIRLQPGTGLALEVEEVDLPPRGILGVGGEGRGGRYEQMTFARPDWTPIREAVTRTGRAKLTLATPAMFRDGWRPMAVDPETNDWRLPGGRALHLEAALVGTPQPIGGFDVIRRRPRDLRRAVPAGSVYYLRERAEGGAAAFFDAYHLRCCSDDLADIGFGLAYVGRWDDV